eukprot:CAMPEP_0197861500 /NCGR_PEP_ID=MMETSP1438-20131217/37601_1 /TAXON_ID=1461541 /ORGANISM="Pterosperma sp., Strain CCMP1384" /LENGTH=382 /DNA_ID=CAMNT_0043478695 /DNA_START=146 /DNA_END=1294 /DNA_ORIENTATION=+
MIKASPYPALKIATQRGHIPQTQMFLSANNHYANPSTSSSEDAEAPSSTTNLNLRSDPSGFDKSPRAAKIKQKAEKAVIPGHVDVVPRGDRTHLLTAIGGTSQPLYTATIQEQPLALEMTKLMNDLNPAVPRLKLNNMTSEDVPVARQPSMGNESEPWVPLSAREPRASSLMISPRDIKRLSSGTSMLGSQTQRSIRLFRAKGGPINSARIQIDRESLDGGTHSIHKLPQPPSSDHPRRRHHSLNQHPPLDLDHMWQSSFTHRMSAPAEIAASLGRGSYSSFAGSRPQISRQRMNDNLAASITHLPALAHPPPILQETEQFHSPYCLPEGLDINKIPPTRGPMFQPRHTDLPMHPRSEFIDEFVDDSILRRRGTKAFDNPFM